MAQYVYRCDDQHETVLTRSIHDGPLDDVLCLECNKTASRRYTPVAARFKGVGWGAGPQQKNTMKNGPQS